MNLGEFLKNLNKLVKENPQYEKLDVVSSADDEGNGFNKVYFEPQIGHYYEKDKDFISFEAMNERVDDGDWEELEEVNSICIN